MPRGPWSAADQSCSFEGENHLVDGRRSDAEELLHVGLGWRSPIEARIGVDECQILALLGREGGPGSARHLIYLSIYLGLQRGGCDEHTLSCDVDPM